VFVAGHNGFELNPKETEFFPFRIQYILFSMGIELAACDLLAKSWALKYS
jgi:hypothetical protein